MKNHIVTRRKSVLSALLGATALSALGFAAAAQTAGACQLVDGVLPAGCEQANAGLVVTMPTGENASTVVAPPSQTPGGFSVRINGRPVLLDESTENAVRRVDVALADANVQVVFDGLGIVPRLDLEVLGGSRAHRPGDAVMLQSSLNYPAFVSRGEVRLIDLAAPGGPQTVTVLPINPNGRTEFAMPAGEDIVAVHRVYDSHGRYDETVPVPLSAPDGRPTIDDVEEGGSLLARQRIPIQGGAVTVSGTGVQPGTGVRALGETIRPDLSGGFVIQRIVPVGVHDIDVLLDAPGRRPVQETRRVEVPRSEWFYAGIADLTVGMRTDADTGGTEYFDQGRIAAYVDGRTASGVEITASVDTGEGPLDEIFRELDEKDPSSVLDRLSSNDLYPTYGDDSTIVDNTPTDGKIYVRVEQDGNFAQWGNFANQIAGNSYIRNERTLYGAQGHWATQDARPNGEAIAALDIFAAKPDRLPQRDVFRGTGGSVYFLEKQDIGVGTETLTVELRDPVSNRVIGSRQLTPGVDYEINYTQGIVTLTRPLQPSMVGQGLISDATTQVQVRLVTQYEYTPTAGDVDGYTYGGRAELWATDRLRVGVSGLVEQTGIADQSIVGADIRYQMSDNTWVQLDYAQSEGPGFGSTYSDDGGLIVDTIAGGNGSGRAFQLSGQATFSDLGFGGKGLISGYYEFREEGFSSLDLTVTSNTGDEELWGLAVQGQMTSALSYMLAIDSYENGVGDLERTAEGSLTAVLNDRMKLDVGVEHLNRDNATEVGTRTDAAVRVTYGVLGNAEVYAFVQKTLQVSGLDPNDRIGVGGRYRWGKGWAIEAEVSNGDQGIGARALVSHDDGQGGSTYIGYELEPGREIAGLELQGRDQGRFISGAQRSITSDLRVFGENSYDLFGQYKSLVGSYGLTYAPTEATSYTVTLTNGNIYGAGSDFERYALSFAAAYSDDVLSVSGKVEYRTDDGIISGDAISEQTLLLAGSMSYKFSEDARIVGSFKYASTDTDQSSLLDGQYGDFVLGYAFRPVMNDRLNLLVRYRYLHDMYGQRVDGTDEDGVRQRSHVFSIDGIYDLNPQWSLGAKVGYRFSETAADSTSPFVQNDAWLAAGSVTYHMVHEWDAMLEARSFNTVQAGTSEFGILAAGYRHFGNNLKLGLGYNFGSFSDDLTDMVQDDHGVFFNVVAKF